MNSIFKIARTVDKWLSPDVRRAQDILDFGNRATARELTRFRDDAFRKQIQYIFENVPYYRKVMDERGLKPRDFNSTHDITLLPVLTKNILRSENDRLFAKNAIPYTIRRSGGTTGEPIPSYADRRSRALETYAYFRGLQWMGWNPKQKRVILSGGSLGIHDRGSLRKRLKNYATGVVSLPAFSLKEDNVAEYHLAIQRSGPCILIGYASVLDYLAKMSLENGYTYPDVNFVYSTAEILYPEWAVNIQSAFGCSVKSFYGCGEINSLGFQIESDGAYRVPDEHVIVESYQGDQEVEQKSVLITSLFNRVFPLLRYANGDLAEITPASSKQKRTLINNLIGRTADQFIRQDGSKVSPSFGPHTVFRTNLKVEKYQFIQWDLNKFEFRYLPLEEDISLEEKKKMVKVVRGIMNHNIDLKFIKSSEFIMSSNGKFRIMVNKLS